MEKSRAVWEKKEEARLDSTRSGIEIRSETRRWPRCRLGTNIRNGRREGGERRYQLLAELVNEHSHDILISLTATFAKHRGLKNLKTFFLTDYDDDDDGDGFFLARYERNKRNTGKRILGRGYIWLWPEFSRVNLTRPVSLVSTSPRNRINRDPLRTVFSLFLPSFLSFFLSRGSLKKYPRIISFRTVFASHARLALPFKRTIFGRKGTG